MSSMRNFVIIPFSLVSFCYPMAFATKCLKAQTMDELKKDFPVVIRGEVLSREKIDENSFSLKIAVKKLLNGKLKLRELKAVEIHYGKGFWRTYEIGKEYIFPIDTKGKKSSYEVVMPVDGCPDLPVE